MYVFSISSLCTSGRDIRHLPRTCEICEPARAREYASEKAMSRALTCQSEADEVAEANWQKTASAESYVSLEQGGE